MEIKLTEDNFMQEVLEAEKPVLVDFWAEWCGPCKMLAPELEALAEELEGKISVGKVNVDEEPSLAMEYKVSSIPLLILFKDGEIVKKSVGYMTKDEIKEELGL